MVNQRQWGEIAGGRGFAFELQIIVRRFRFLASADCHYLIDCTIASTTIDTRHIRINMLREDVDSPRLNPPYGQLGEDNTTSARKRSSPPQSAPAKSTKRTTRKRSSFMMQDILDDDSDTVPRRSSTEVRRASGSAFRKIADNGWIYVNWFLH